MRNDIILEDTTLRDGEQMPGTSFPISTKLAIHDILVDIGVKWIEAGIPKAGNDELSALKKMLARGSDAMLVAWNRGIREDVAFSIDLGFKAIHIGLPTSETHIKDSLGRDRKWLLERAREVVSYAKNRGVFVSISAEDVGRTEKPFLQEYASVVFEAGADRLRLSDTIGILTPIQYASCVKNVIEVCPIDIQCHTHNDFGLAVANTLSGLEAGARYFHVTAGGIGERAGMPDLVQIVLALKFLFGKDIGIYTEKFYDFSRKFAQLLHYEIPPWQPIIGDNVFAHESGIHVNAMIKNPKTFEPFPPDFVGQKRKYILGKHSGRESIRFALIEEGIEIHEELLSICLEKVRALSIKQQKSVTLEQLFALYGEIVTEESHTEYENR